MCVSVCAFGFFFSISSLFFSSLSLFFFFISYFFFFFGLAPLIFSFARQRQIQLAAKSGSTRIYLFSWNLYKESQYVPSNACFHGILPLKV